MRHAYGYWNMQRGLRKIHLGTIMKNDIFIMRIHSGNSGESKKSMFEVINKLEPIKCPRVN